MIRAAALFLSFSFFQVTDAQRARVAWVPNPRVADGTWVADPARHLSDAARAQINADIAALERETGAEIAVVVVDSTAGLEPFDFALAIHRVWGVGKRGVNNGVVLLWVPAQRAVWISVGMGLEGAIPDRRAGRIRDEEIFSAFRRGEFDAGMIAGVRALAQAARGEGRAGGDAGAGAGAAEESGGFGTVAMIVSGIVGSLGLGIGGVMGIRRHRRNKPRPCPNGHGLMRRLDEAADDASLDKGEQTEESLKSVDYDVWMCDACGHQEKVPYKAWFSKYSECAQCQRRTVVSAETTLRSASTSSTGLKRVVTHCRHCGARTSREVVIPRVSASSSSSSSGGGGGSSFGGGSAGGGGAGGRY